MAAPELAVIEAAEMEEKAAYLNCVAGPCYPLELMNLQLDLTA